MKPISKVDIRPERYRPDSFVLTVAKSGTPLESMYGLSIAHIREIHEAASELLFDHMRGAPLVTNPQDLACPVLKVADKTRGNNK